MKVIYLLHTYCSSLLQGCLWTFTWVNYREFLIALSMSDFRLYQLSVSSEHPRSICRDLEWIGACSTPCSPPKYGLLSWVTGSCLTGTAAYMTVLLCITSPELQHFSPSYWILPFLPLSTPGSPISLALLYSQPDPYLPDPGENPWDCDTIAGRPGPASDWELCCLTAWVMLPDTWGWHTWPHHSLWQPGHRRSCQPWHCW